MFFSKEQTEKLKSREIRLKSKTKVTELNFSGQSMKKKSGSNLSTLLMKNTLQRKNLLKLVQMKLALHLIETEEDL